tara:strand:- start:97 stop:348 length:252 start_codon:yes stop_codon:yes gene_type:complete
MKIGLVTQENCMRFCRIVESEKTLKIINEHGKYARMLGIAEDARGMVARLDLGTTRVRLPIQQIRVLSDEDIDKIVAKERKFR